MFKDITEANEILSDKTKRQRYDLSNERGDAEFDPNDEGHGHSHGGHGGFGGMGGMGGGMPPDFMEMLFAQAAAQGMGGMGGGFGGGRGGGGGGFPPGFGGGGGFGRR